MNDTPTVRESTGPVTEKGYPVFCIPTPINLSVFCQVLLAIDEGFAKRGVSLYVQGDTLGQPWIMIDKADIPKLKTTEE